MRQLTRRLADDGGSALITALLAAALMLGLGLALLSIVDTQANQSATERTRDRGFNLSESVLNSEAFVLGRSWPASGTATVCGGLYFDDTLGDTAATDAATALLRNNLNASYTDDAYAGATWKVNICDDSEPSTVWSETLLTTNRAYDFNTNNKVWVRAEATVGGKKRIVAGLVQVRSTNPLKSKYGLVAGNVSDDLGPVTSALTNNTLLTSVTAGLLNPASPPVLADPAYPAPLSGVTGVRCGLLENVLDVKTCVTGAIGALAQVPLVNTLVTQNKFEQYPYTSSTTPSSIGQLRKQSQTPPGVYKATAPGHNSAASAPSCAISGATTSSVVFIEQVGTGDQYCYIDVATSVQYKALVIGSGRVVIRGNNAITAYATAGTNRFTGVIYALNQQTSDHTSSTPVRELIRVEKGARVKGAVHADGKNATIGLVAPDFDTTALVNGLLCPGALCVLAPTLNGLLGTLGVNGTVNALINGTCLVTLPIFGCTVSLPGIGVNSVAGGILSQLSTYGSAIRSDVATINSLSVYGASGVVPSTFRDLQAK